MPILIRRGGQYVRYNGKYATDIELCDCSCDDYPPDCTCESLPDTLYAKLTKYQWVAGDGVIGIESVTWDLTLNKGVPSEPATPCGDVFFPGNSWYADDFSERSIHGCNGIPYEKYMMDSVLVVRCVAGAGLLRLDCCNCWKNWETCPDYETGSGWRYPTATPTVQPEFIECNPDGSLYAVYDDPTVVNIGRIRRIEISSSSF